MARKTFLADADQLTLAQLRDLSWRTLDKVMKEMSYGRKLELMKECEDAINGAYVKAFAPGSNFSPARGPMTEERPTMTVEKYSYLYTCLAGWMTKEDLAARELEKLSLEERIKLSKQQYRAKVYADMLKGGRENG